MRLFCVHSSTMNVKFRALEEKRTIARSSISFLSFATPVFAAAVESERSRRGRLFFPLKRCSLLSLKSIGPQLVLNVSLLDWCALSCHKYNPRLLFAIPCHCHLLIMSARDVILHPCVVTGMSC